MPLNQAPENPGEIPGQTGGTGPAGGTGSTGGREWRLMTTNDDENSPMFGNESNGINRIRRKKHPEMTTP